MTTVTDSVVVVIERIDYDDFYFFIVPDIAAGRQDRYTIYRVPSSPSRGVKIIGRELPLEHARSLCAVAASGKVVRRK